MDRGKGSRKKHRKEGARERGGTLEKSDRDYLGVKKLEMAESDCESQFRNVDLGIVVFEALVIEKETGVELSGNKFEAGRSRSEA
jgi:hypothetical protein